MRDLGRHDQPVVADERLARRADAPLAVGGQRQVRDARVPAVERPLGLAVADDEDAGDRHGGVDRVSDFESMIGKKNEKNGKNAACQVFG